MPRTLPAPQVPLMWTVYLQLAFRHFVLLGPGAEARQPGFFEVRAQSLRVWWELELAMLDWTVLGT